MNDLDKKFTPAFIAIIEKIKKEPPENLGQFFYEELKKIGQIERIKNIYRCADKNTKKKVWFRPNTEQIKYLEKQTRRDMILKSRQIGFTELSIIIGRDNCLFVPGSTEGLMAHTKDKAVKNLFQRVRDGFNWFVDDWKAWGIDVVLSKDEGTKIIIDSVCGQAFKSSYEVSAEFRSSSLTRLHRSEAAFTNEAKLRSSADAVPFSCQIIDESTPNGRGGTFYANWQESKSSKKKDDVYVWEPHFFPWFEHYPEPGHELRKPTSFSLTEEEKYLKTLGASDEALLWRRWKIKENFIDSPEIFDQEYPSDDVSCWLGGTSIVPRKYLVMMDKWVKHPFKKGHLVPQDGWFKIIEDQRGFLSIWEMPQAEEQYVIGADPSEGIGKDYAAAYIRKRSNGDYVARVHGQLYPEEFAETLANLGKFYNQAHINFEVNNHGAVLLDRLTNQKKYFNVYHRREINTIDGKWKNEIGFITDRASKERIVNNWVARLREGKLHPMDTDLVDEASNFERDENGRLGAKSSCHDDLFMAACLTEEMDVALGEYSPPKSDHVYYDTQTYDEFTGMPI